MLMRPPNGGVDDQVFEVGTFHQCTEDTFPNAVPGPATEALEHAVPVAEHGRQVAPRRTGPRDPKHRVDEQTIVRAMPALITFLTPHEILDAQPLRVRQFPPNQDRPP